MIGQRNVDVSPNDRQVLLFLCRDKFVLYGGAKGGGKSWGIRTKQILRRFKYPRTKGLLLRRTYPELYRNHILKIQEDWPMLVYNDQKHTFTFPNGSILELGSAQNETDILGYQGADYEDIGVDQAEQFTEYQFNILRSILRTTHREIQTQMYLGANPGGVGQGWLKRYFINNPQNHTGHAQYAYIPAKVTDNPVLMKSDPQYMTELENLPEPLRRAYLEGDWNIFSGQVFSEWRADKHIITTFDYPLASCRKIIGFDWGYNAPGCALWMAFSPDNHVYVYREIYQSLKTPEIWAKEIAGFLATERVDYIVLPHDCFSIIQGNRSIADTFRKELGLPIRAARTLQAGARKNRVAITHQYLAQAPDNKPYLRVHVNCRNLIRTLPELIYDQHNPEDVDTTGEDHSYDALSVALMEKVLKKAGVGVVKIEKEKETPRAWTVGKDGTLPLPDFAKAFKEALYRFKGTAGLENRR